MPYAGITFAQIRSQLAERLNDTGKVLSIDAELGLHIQDALRLWNILTGDNKVNYALSATAGTVWYDMFKLGFAGTLINIQGGVLIPKYRIRLSAGSNAGKVFNFSASFQNINNIPIVIALDWGAGQNTVTIIPGQRQDVFLSVTGTGGQIQVFIQTQNIGDTVLVIAANAFGENHTSAPGVNIIPSVSVQFQGTWNSFGTLTTTTANTVSPFSSPRFVNLSDQDIYLRLTYALMEPPSTTAVVATAQFAQDELISAVQRKRDEFIFRTGCTGTIETLAVAPNTATVSVPPSVIQTPRAYWLPAVGGTAWPLFKSDEFALTAYNPKGATTPGQPITFSAGMEPVLTLDIIPAPDQAGNLELLTIESQGVLSAAALSLIFIPQDFIPGLMWGALADLLNFNLEAKDTVKAQIASQRFQELVELAAQYGFIYGSRVDGVDIFADGVNNLDIYQPTWRTVNASPNMLGLANANLIAYPVSVNAIITLSMLANANLPVLDADFIQLGNEVIDVILDEAQATASFKLGGDEALSAHQLHSNIVKLAAKRNAKVRAMACFADILNAQVNRENLSLPLEMNYDDSQ